MCCSGVRGSSRDLAGILDQGRERVLALAVSDRVDRGGSGRCGVRDRLYALARGRTHEPFTGLLGELMSMIVLPYLGPAAARREQDRPAAILLRRACFRVENARIVAVLGRDPLRGVPMRLTYRTAMVLETPLKTPVRPIACRRARGS